MKLKMLTLFACFAIALSAQTVITSTTLSSAVTLTANTINVASATTFAAGRLALVDMEVMYVTAVSGTQISVIRGYGGPVSATTHASGKTIWVQVPNAFKSVDPAGQCVRTNLQYVPWINIVNGDMFDCLGVTTAGQWVRTNRPGVPVVGSTVASATSITPTGTYFVVSGTTAIATIVVPAGWAPGNCLEIQPSGVFATTTADNIGLISSASVVGRILRMCWSGLDWYPSYVSWLRENESDWYPVDTMPPALRSLFG